MDSINVEYTRLLADLGHLLDITFRLNEEIEKIAGYTADLDIFWDGDANSAYIQKIGEDLLDMNVIMIRVRNAVKSGVLALDLYQKNEKEIIRMIGDMR